jgi:Arc/MetJ-type ribon-helix-helix transcriptional regulator
MDAQDAWMILAEQGILFRPVSPPTQGWEYTISMPTLTWYGPYPTREEALRAALRHLLSQAQNSPSTIESAAQGTTATSSSEQLTAQLQLLRQQLFELHRAEALLGIAHAPEIRPRIEKLKEQIKHIQERIEQ